ncbi:MAG: FAD-dependent monooxygenase [Stellaceae bacterium]
MTKILIVGGGVAGLTAAAALAQRNVDCEVIELAGDALGAAITITGRALDALDSIGARTLCAAEGIIDPLPQGSGRSSSDLRNSARPADDTAVGLAPTGMKAIGLYRPVLSRILLSCAASYGARVRVGVGIKALDQDTTGVTARFTDGTDGRYDLVVGADGIRSTVRALIFGDAIQPVYAGQCNVRWMTPGEPIPALAGIYFAPWGKLLSYPLPHQKLVYAITVFGRDAPDYVDQEAARALVLEQLSVFAEPGMRALRARLTADLAMIHRPFEWLMVPPPWHRGRIVLIGDAAHATTAHMSAGGGMAIEDAVVLAETLTAAASVTEALVVFMRRRFERVRMVVETSVDLARMETDGVSPEVMLAHSAQAFATLAETY